MVLILLPTPLPFCCPSLIEMTSGAALLHCCVRSPLASISSISFGRGSVWVKWPWVVPHGTLCPDMSLSFSQILDKSKIIVNSVIMPSENACVFISYLWWVRGLMDPHLDTMQKGCVFCYFCEFFYQGMIRHHILWNSLGHCYLSNKRHRIEKTKN